MSGTVRTQSIYPKVSPPSVRNDPATYHVAEVQWGKSTVRIFRDRFRTNRFYVAPTFRFVGQKGVDGKVVPQVTHDEGDRDIQVKLEVLPKALQEIIKSEVNRRLLIPRTQIEIGLLPMDTLEIVLKNDRLQGCRSNSGGQMHTIHRNYGDHDFMFTCKDPKQTKLFYNHLMRKRNMPAVLIPRLSIWGKRPHTLTADVVYTATNRLSFENNIRPRIQLENRTGNYDAGKYFDQSQVAEALGQMRSDLRVKIVRDGAEERHDLASAEGLIVGVTQKVLTQVSKKIFEPVAFDINDWRDGTTFPIGRHQIDANIIKQQKQEVETKIERVVNIMTDRAYAAFSDNKSSFFTSDMNDHFNRIAEGSGASELTIENRKKAGSKNPNYSVNDSSHFSWADVIQKVRTQQKRAGGQSSTEAVKRVIKQGIYNKLMQYRRDLFEYNGERISSRKIFLYRLVSRALSSNFQSRLENVRLEDIRSKPVMEVNSHDHIVVRKEEKPQPRQGEPIGYIREFTGSRDQIPDGYMVCDGRSLNTRNYEDLFFKLLDRTSMSPKEGFTLNQRYKHLRITNEDIQNGNWSTKVYNKFSEFRLPNRKHEIIKVR